MSTHAHAPRRSTSSKPPTESRQCAAFTNPPPARRQVWNEDRARWTVEYVEHAPERCSMSASPWLPEVDYCATHLPADAVLVVRERMATWDALAAYLWESTLAEHPYQAGPS